MSIQKNTPNFLKHNGLSFTTIINQSMALIPDAGALGIYCYLSSKPENWEICNSELSKRFGVGRDYIIKRMAILKEVGLVKTKPNRNEKGEITSWETTLLNYPDPQDTENPYSGKKHTRNTQKHQNTENPYSSNQVVENKENKLSTASRILKTQNLGNPESGKTDTNNKRAFKNKINNKNKRKSFCENENQKKHDNSKKHAFAPSMDQMANEKLSTKENEEFKRSPMPDSLRNMCKKLSTGLKRTEGFDDTRRKSNGYRLCRSSGESATQGT